MALPETSKPAPDFTARATGAREIRLADFKEKQNVLLFFYAAAFTPV